MIQMKCFKHFAIKLIIFGSEYSLMDLKVALERIDNSPKLSFVKTTIKSIYQSLRLFEYFAIFR